MNVEMKHLQWHQRHHGNRLTSHSLFDTLLAPTFIEDAFSGYTITERCAPLNVQTVWTPDHRHVEHPIL